MAFSSDPTLEAQWNALAGQTGDAATAQRQLLASQNEAYQTNQNIQNMFNQGQTSSTNFSNPPPIQSYPTDSGQIVSTGFPTNPPPTSPLVDMRGGEGNDMLYGPQGTYTSEGTPILTSVTPPTPSSSLVDTRNMLRDDVRYGPQGTYTSEGTPLIVGGANQVTSPLASMSSAQQPQGMIQGQAKSPDIQQNFPPANTTYDPTKPIGDQIKALTSLADRQALLNNYGDYQTNQNIQGLYGLNKTNADTFLKYSNADKTGKTTNAFEQALMANPKSANALLSEFAGTGSNPLLGQYNVLPGGTILPYQGGVPTPGMAGTPATTNITGALPSSTTTSGSTTSGTSTSPAKIDLDSLKNVYGITNPALIKYITNNKGIIEGTNVPMSVSNIQELKTAFNSKPPQEIDDMQTSSSGPLVNQAHTELLTQAADIQHKKDLADPNSWIYQKGNVPVYRPASQSTNAVGDVFTTKNSGIVDQYKDQNGYVHITSGGNQYLINPNSNRIISTTPITHDDKLSPYGQGPNPYQGPSV